MGKQPGPTDIPDWDVALEALIRDEAIKLDSGLSMDDFKRLAREHAIRLDDIMATVVQLVKHERWRHEARDQQGKPVAESELQDLYVFSRVDEKLVEQYVIHWLPVPGIYRG